LSTDDVDGPANIDAANAGDRMFPQFEPDIEHIIQEFEQKLHVQVCVCLVLLIVMKRKFACISSKLYAKYALFLKNANPLLLTATYDIITSVRSTEKIGRFSQDQSTCQQGSSKRFYTISTNIKVHKHTGVSKYIC